MKVYLQTLGCPKNIVDSEILLGILYAQGIRLIEDARHADCIIINTCAFLLSAREEAIETIFDAIRLKKAGSCKTIIVVGCLPQKYRKELEQELPEVDYFFDQLDFVQIGKKLKTLLGFDGKLREDRYLLTPPHYAYLKIAEGCDNNCSYCTIPSIKGNYVSREPEKILNEASRLVAAGVLELIVIAQDTTYYGKDRNGMQLSVLLHELSTINDLKWLRLMYTYPRHLDREVLQEIRDNRKLCKYIDLPIQHIADSILRSMNRRMRSDDIKHLLDEIRAQIPEVAIRTTVIVGYPGETDREFNELRDFIKDSRFERLGIFKYSREEDTRAAELDDQVPEQVMDERYEELMEIQESISFDRNRKLIGRSLEVIVDEFDEHEKRYIGRTQWDSPEIDNRVLLENQARPGSFVTVKVTQAYEYDIAGSVSDPG